MHRGLLVSILAVLAVAVFASAASAASGPDTLPYTAAGLLQLDSDADGLIDTWEAQGVDVDGDGRIDLDLPGMGASPRHKDIFLEIDWMPGHKLSNQAVNIVVNSFAKAPLPNPDGRTGIRLHVDNGPGSIMNPATGAKWASRSLSNSVPHAKVLGVFTTVDYDWAQFDQIKAANFQTARASAFRYAVSAHQYGHLQNTSSGLARGIPSGNFIVSLGGFCAAGLECSGTVAQQAGTIMHEFGHTLGLHHGGDDDLNYEPNFLSVMNYFFQFSGLPLRGRGLPRYDYSRVLDGAIPDLDEQALDETAGIPAPAALARIYSSSHWCPNEFRPKLVRFNAPIDWNCDGVISPAGTPVATSINRDNVISVLRGVDDWARLVFRGPSGFGLGFVSPRRTPRNEVPAEQLLLASSPVTQDTKAPTLSGAAAKVAKGTARVTITARDDKALERLVVSLGTTQRTVLSASRTIRFSATVKAGAAITAIALDGAGNKSKPLRLRAPR